MVGHTMVAIWYHLCAIWQYGILVRIQRHTGYGSRRSPCWTIAYGHIASLSLYGHINNNGPCPRWPPAVNESRPNPTPQADDPHKREVACGRRRGRPAPAPYLVVLLCHVFCAFSVVWCTERWRSLLSCRGAAGAVRCLRRRQVPWRGLLCGHPDVRRLVFPRKRGTDRWFNSYVRGSYTTMWAGG
jgi:hypothetical protein